jgi:tRNA threonylcarbamoyladenosine biosynthesis protein TsaE
MHVISKSEEETKNLGKEIASRVKGGEVFALFGDLGSGKTVFAKGFAHGLKIKQTITSPTFGIIKIYPVKSGNVKNLIHIDAYRLNSASEGQNIGLSELIDNHNNVLLVEWPEKIWPLIKEKSIAIKFSLIDGSNRDIEIKGTKWN